MRTNSSDRKPQPRDGWSLSRGRSRSWLALLIAFPLILASCGTEQEGADAPDEGGTEAADGGDTEEQIEIRLWSSREFFVPPDEFAAFEEEHPNIDVVWDVQSNDDILQQMQRMQDAGQKMPDIIQDDPINNGVYAELGITRPIDDIIEQWEEEDPEGFEKLVMPYALDIASVDGVPYGVGTSMTFDQLYYNVPWFEEAGIELPFESLDDMIEATNQLKEVRPDGVPLAVQAKPDEGVTALKGMLNAAGTPFEGAVPDLTSEAGTYVIDWYLQMAANDLIPEDAISLGEGETRALFLSGTAGLMVDSLGTAKDLIAAEDFTYEEDWSLTVLPRTRTGDTEDGRWIAVTSPWLVTTDTEHPEEVGLLLRYLADTEVLVESTVNGSIPPANTEALADPRVREVMPFLTEDLQEALAGAEIPPLSTEAGEVEEILVQMFGEIVNGTDASAEELAEKYQQQLDAL